MSSTIKTVKILIVIFNVVFMIFGVTLQALGIYSLYSEKVLAVDYVLEEKFSLYNLSIGLIVFGVLVACIALLGCCGVYKESWKLLVAFAMILTVILLAALLFMAFAFLRREQIEEYVDDNFKEKLLNGYIDESSNKHYRVFRDMWDGLQKRGKCCGYDGWEDWTYSEYVSPPRSCCRDGVIGECSPHQMHQDGCKEAVLEHLLEGPIYLLGFSSLTLICIIIAAIILAAILAHKLKKEKVGKNLIAVSISQPEQTSKL